MTAWRGPAALAVEVEEADSVAVVVVSEAADLAAVDAALGVAEADGALAEAGVVDLAEEDLAAVDGAAVLVDLEAVEGTSAAEAQAGLGVSAGVPEGLVPAAGNGRAAVALVPLVAGNGLVVDSVPAVAAIGLAVVVRVNSAAAG